MSMSKSGWGEWYGFYECVPEDNEVVCLKCEYNCHEYETYGVFRNGKLEEYLVDKNIVAKSDIYAWRTIPEKEKEAFFRLLKKRSDCE